MAFKNVQLFRFPDNKYALVGQGFPRLSHVEDLIPLLFGLRFAREGEALLCVLPVFVCFFHVIIFNTLDCPISERAATPIGCETVRAPATARLTSRGKLVPQDRIELSTYPLPRGCATTTLLRQPKLDPIGSRAGALL